MRDGQPATRVTRLADYQPPAFLVRHTRLDVDLREGQTVVTAELDLYRNPACQSRPDELVLDGEQLQLRALFLDGRALAEGDYRLDDDHLVVPVVSNVFTLKTVVAIEPENNTALEGLYLSNGMYCTQCEAEGFRRITFFPDRPDVLSRFTTTLHADKTRYPLLLSNGNPVHSEEEEGGRHCMVWEDPYPKPCYLFALVAGDLACLEEGYTTFSGRRVALRLYAEHRDLEKLEIALYALKSAMYWDEYVYGRQYDLDIFQIVAVSHFNMGAMENKGLNIFNTACLLADPATSTDAAIQRVRAVVAHEYFHNWSGNRVTCRDWFQLSLKEGFTVFREQSFMADQHSSTVNRVEDVKLLINRQFPEDQGPMAHPVQPAEYQKIDNFYTLTVYEKGAEIVRMLEQLVGEMEFRRVTDLYFERFDGQAATCDDFVTCAEEVSGYDLTQFKRWYTQAGTPILTVTDEYIPNENRKGGQYRLTFHQHTPPTAGQPDKLPLMIPVKLMLLNDDDGFPIMLDEPSALTEDVVLLRCEQETRVYEVPRRPVPSLLRGFSAPVQLHFDYDEEHLRYLLGHDNDGFVRWDAAQRLYFAALGRIMNGTDIDADADREARLLAPLFERVIAGSIYKDYAGMALLLTLPEENAVGDRHAPFDPQAVHRAVLSLRVALGAVLEELWWRQVEHLRAREYAISGVGERGLRRVALSYRAAAAAAGRADRHTLVKQLVTSLTRPTCMTEELSALQALAHHQLDGADEALAAFAERWKDDPLVMDQWFAVQASTPGIATVAQARVLLAHPAFEWTLPNRVRALVGTLVNSNPSAFHASNGDGYRFFAQALEKLDGINPQVAARLAGGAARMDRLVPALAGQLRAALADIRPGASANLAEVLDRIL